jgi:hypothetical protein
MKKVKNYTFSLVDVICPRCHRLVQWTCTYGDRAYGYCHGLLCYAILDEVMSFCTDSGDIIEIPKSKLRDWKEDN